MKTRGPQTGPGDSGACAAERAEQWSWPVDLAVCDRRGELDAAELDALGFAVESMAARRTDYVKEALPKLERLLDPVDKVMNAVDARDNERRGVRRLLIRGMHARRRAYWTWGEDEWVDLLRDQGIGGEQNPGIRAVPNPMLAAAYFLCGFDDFFAVSKRFMTLKFARRIFGRERLEAARHQIRGELVSWGWGTAVLDYVLPTLLSRIMLANRSPRLEDLTTEKLQALDSEDMPRYMRRSLLNVSRALAVQGVIAAPIEPRRDTRHYNRDFVEYCPEEWARWCRQWRDTCTVSPKTRTNNFGYLLQAGRWLARNHPEVAEPAQWDRSLAASYVRAMSELTVGQWSDTSHISPERVGQPASARTKSSRLQAISIFFRDLQEWGWIDRRFDPRLAFKVPRSIHGLIRLDPRPIADEIWAKLMAAGLGLAVDDLATPQYLPGQHGSLEKGGLWYPFEMVRALTAVWLFSGLRNDEIRRLRVGCVRWQREEVEVPGPGLEREVLPEDAVCWLDVPANKTNAGQSKPVDSLVGRAVEAWETVRPRQPRAVDPKTREKVDFLFFYKGKRLGGAYVNGSLIPLLCRKAGVPEEDARGHLTSHRARSTMATQLLNAREPMSLFEVSEWLGHADPRSTLHYADIAPTRLAKSYHDAEYFKRNVRMIDVLVDGDAVRNGEASDGEPWKFYDLGHGYCTYDFFQQCPHLRACFAELKVRKALYAVRHEKKLCYRPLGFGMELSARPPARATEEGQDTRPPPTRHLRRHLLCTQVRLSLAVVAPRLSALANGLLPFSKVSPERDVAPHLHHRSGSGEKEGWQGPRRLRRDHGFSVHKDYRGVQKTEAGSLRPPQQRL